MHLLITELLSVIASDSVPPKDKLVLVQTRLKEIREAKEPINIDDYPPNYGRTALMTAAINPGHEIIVRELVRAKANLNLKSNTGKTALIYAATIGNEISVDVLIQAGADLDIQGSNQRTALVAAVSMKQPNVNIIKLLIKAGAGLDIPDDMGKTALDMAIKKMNFEVVVDLLKYDAKIRNFSKLHNFLDSVIRPELANEVRVCRGICYRQEGRHKEAKEIYEDLIHPDDDDYSRNLVIEHSAVDRVMRAYLLGESFRGLEDREAWIARAEREVELNQFLDVAYTEDAPHKEAREASLFRESGSFVLFPPLILQTAVKNNMVTITANNESKPDDSNPPEPQVMVDGPSRKNPSFSGRIGK